MLPDLGDAADAQGKKIRASDTTLDLPETTTLSRRYPDTYSTGGKRKRTESEPVNVIYSQLSLPSMSLLENEHSTKKRQRSVTTYQQPIKPKQCHSCQSTETPEWRKGPLGPRTLCNACGLIWAKLTCDQQKKTKSDVRHTTLHASPDGSESPPTARDGPGKSTKKTSTTDKYALSFLLS